jgi:predicted DNA binding CopG/RHH family protein
MPALLDHAREKRDKRFNFFISPKLLEFLEKTSNGDGITKSKYIRNLIVEHMRQNKNLTESVEA